MFVRLIIALLLLIPSVSYSAVFYSTDFDDWSTKTDEGWSAHADVSLESGANCYGGSGKCIKVTYPADDTATRYFSKNILSQELAEIYLQVRIKHTTNQSHTKFIKFKGDTSGTGYANATFTYDGNMRKIMYGDPDVTGGAYLDTQVLAVYGVEGAYDCAFNPGTANGSLDTCGGTYQMPLNTWTTYEVHLKYNTDGNADGAFDIWIDGTRYAEATGVKNMHDSNSRKIWLVLLADYGGTPSNNYDAFELWFDDITMSTTPIGGEAGDPYVSITATDSTATEASTTTGTIQLSCPQCSGDETVVVTRSGTATYGAGNDYTDNLSSPVSLSSTPTTITLTPVDDEDNEGDETAIYTMGTCTNCQKSNTSATITITDDDTGDTTAPVIGGMLPSPSTVSCTAGQSEVEVEFGVSNVTDATTPGITCKYRGYSGFDWSVGNALTPESTGASGEDHTKTGISFSCGATYTYFAKCRDSVGNESSEQTIQFTVSQADNRGINIGEGELGVTVGGGTLGITID